ncbi:MAG: metal-binding protein [Pyrinomonadaceae bacterium]|nr:metal-binding protein [Pyrinomonadaceae bacterium]
MPSGKTHDAITLVLAMPTFVAGWLATESLWLASVGTCLMLFGGLMFGPDLDTDSVQYKRWGAFRLLWYPYRVFFKHRSRWSHGLLFGTLIRIIYFAFVLALLIALGIYLRATLIAHTPFDFNEIARAWEATESAFAHYGGKRLALTAFVGVWWGAATHTITDVAWSMLRKGTEIF